MPVMSGMSGRRARRLRNLMFDLRAGHVLAGNRASRHPSAHDVVNTDVTALERIFEGRIRDGDVLVDVGCGKGRVLSWWAANSPGSRIVGLELDEQVAGETRARVRRHPRVSVIAGDAIENLPPDGTLFYLHNPFGEDTVRAFARRLGELRPGLAGIRILYYNPLHADVFEGDPAWSVERVSIGAERFHALCVIEPSA
jgi:SAM-dependent methyltransferase